jgi:hydrogenase nickel incorporation protein HypA/HybF
MMHELSLCRSIERIVSRAAGSRRVHEVEIDIGALRQVVPATLEHCWSLVTRGTALADARLVVNDIAATLRCRECAASTVLSDSPVMMCSCGGYDVDVVSGEEFAVRSIEVEGDHG